MVVLDSSFLIAFHNRRDVHHDAAAEAMEELLAGAWGQAVLLEYVFLEVVTVLLARRGLGVATTVGTVLLEAPEIDFVPCSEFFLETLAIFRSQRDGNLSFTDAAIVAAAHRKHAEFVATFDRDFDGVAEVRVVPAR